LLGGDDESHFVLSLVRTKDDSDELASLDRHSNRADPKGGRRGFVNLESLGNEAFHRLFVNLDAGRGQHSQALLGQLGHLRLLAWEGMHDSICGYLEEEASRSGSTKRSRREAFRWAQVV
jgi:hypothetical protein